MSEIDPVQQYGRIRRLANRYCWAVQTQLERLKENESYNPKEEGWPNWKHYTLKNDWEALAVFLVRLRRCLSFLENLKPDIQLDPSFASRFDAFLPSLQELRNFEEHWDDYSRERGRNLDAHWGHLESYQYGADEFSNGFATIAAKDAFDASLVAWDAVLSVEEQAQKLGYLTWDDRFGPEGKFRRTA